MVANRSDILDVLELLSRENHGLIHTTITENNGVSRAILWKLSKSGILSRLAPGQYIFASELGDEMLSLSQRSSLIVFSHESALYLNGMTDRTPFEHSVTVPSSKRLAVSIRRQCKVYYVKDELAEIGKTIRNTVLGGNPVPAYDRERTVCDIVRSRSRMAEETLLASLKMYAASPDKDLVRLSAYADAFKVASIVGRYLKGLL